MLDAPHTSHATALELENQTLRIAAVSWAKKKARLDRVAEIIPEKDDVKPLYTGLKKESLLVTALPSSETIVRPLEIKLKKDRDIAAVLKFQVEPLLPFPSENGVADRIKLGETADGTLLTIVAARKDHLQNHLSLWASHQIEPEVVTSEITALVSFGNLFHAKDDPYFIVHIGPAHTTCILVKNRKLIASQACLPEADPEQQKLDLIRILFALEKKTKGEEVHEILLTGTCIPENGLNLPGKTVCEPQPNPEFDLPAKELQKYAIPLGAALSAMPDNADQINFRQQDLSYPDPWKRFKKPLAIYLSLCTALSVAFYFFGSAFIGYEEDRIRQDYVELLSSMRKPYTHFESDYVSKNKKGDEEVIIPAKQLSQQDILERLDYLHKEIKSTPDMFPLLPNVPRVSDVLAWLGNHPQVVQKESPEAPGRPLIQLENFNYTMIKRPDQTKRQEKYQVKVELEFSTSTPKLAREFHDALIAPNEIVDPKGEVKWSSNRGKYRTSFFLKDKTVYPR